MYKRQGPITVAFQHLYNWWSSVLFGTTDLFLERLGLDSLEQLPPVEDFLPGPEVAGEFELDLQAALGLGLDVGSDDG